MPQGGVITVSVSVVQLAGDALKGTDAQPGDYIAVVVQDTGTGMAPETLERAFEPFFTTKADRGGTGLGLSQVYGFARQSGGFGRIESTRGEGTCVTIFLPAADAALAAAGEDKLQAASGRSYSVLLIDDNPAVLRAVMEGLASDGWDVVGVEGANAALAAADGRRFDIVVTDVDMPGQMSGQQLASELRSRYPDMPVLLMSGAAPACEEAGEQLPFISKPFRKQALVEKMQALIG
jgi:CheY-like chemotaxis protein